MSYGLNVEMHKQVSRPGGHQTPPKITIWRIRRRPLNAAPQASNFRKPTIAAISYIGFKLDQK
jgi:hypothetical protein